MTLSTKMIELLWVLGGEVSLIDELGGGRARLVGLYCGGNGEERITVEFCNGAKLSGSPSDIVPLIRPDIEQRSGITDISKLSK